MIKPKILVTGATGRTGRAVVTQLLIPFLIAILPVASVAQSPSGGASGVPSVAIPKTTEVLVIQTAKQGVTPQQVP
jgi:hypothetical protein